jgi:hypothetical protein
VPSASATVERQPALRLRFDDGAPYSRDRRVYLYRVAAHVERLCRGTTWRVIVDADAQTITLAGAEADPELGRAVELLESVAARVNGRAT